MNQSNEVHHLYEMLHIDENDHPYKICHLLKLHYHNQNHYLDEIDYHGLFKSYIDV